MEFPKLGEQCSDSTCKQLDYLPLKCDACGKLFCHQHRSYESHQCPSAYKKDVQVPVCPLCNIPIPVKRGEPPDIAVGAHIDSDCQSDPAKNRRKIFTNKCSFKNCRMKEVVRVLCVDCKANFCLKHRHPTDHGCQGQAAAIRRVAAEKAMARFSSTATAQEAPSSPRNSGASKAGPVRPPVSVIQGNLSEDEALARALALSLEDAPSTSQTDEDLARALAASERQTTSCPSPSRDKCSIS